MKAHINVSVDVEVAQKLQQEKNYSFLINNLVKNYFEMKKETSAVLENKKEELKEELAILETQIEEKPKKDYISIPD